MAVVVDQDIPDEYLDLYLENLRPANEKGYVGIKQLRTHKPYPSLAQILWRKFFWWGTVCFGKQPWVLREDWYDWGMEWYPELFYYNVFMKCFLLGPWNAGYGVCPPDFLRPFYIWCHVYPITGAWPSVEEFAEVELWTDRGAGFEYEDSTPWYSFRPSPSRGEDTLSWQLRSIPPVFVSETVESQPILATSESGGTIVSKEIIQFDDKEVGDYFGNRFFYFSVDLYYEGAFGSTCVVKNTEGFGMEGAVTQLYIKKRIGVSEEWWWEPQWSPPKTTNQYGGDGVLYWSVHRPSDPPMLNEEISDIKWELVTPPDGYHAHDAVSECGGVKLSDTEIEIDITESGVYGTNFFIVEADE